jgi:competence protein ComEC
LIETIQKGEIPFVRILIPLILGIITALHLLPTIAILKGLQYILFSIFAIFFVLIACYKKWELYKNRWLIGLTLSLLIALSGYLITISQSDKLERTHFSNTKQEFLLIVVASEPKVTGGVLRFEAEVKQGIKADTTEIVTGKLLIALKMRLISSSYQYGDLLLIPSSFTEVKPPFNPFEFNYKRYLSNKSIYHHSFINEDQVRLLKPKAGNPILVSSVLLRKILVERFNRFIKDKDAAAVASTLILGYRADLSKEVLNAYSGTGTMHVLSVSGMHVSIVFFVLAFLLKSLERSPKLRLTKAAILILAIWAYSCLTGFSAAVCRAALMFTFIILGKAVKKNQNLYNLLAISAFFLLIYNPFFLVDVGFQLSYLAVCGLIYLYPKIYYLFYSRNFVLDKLWSSSALSIAAQLATFPVSLYYFHQFPVNFLISNLFILLPVTLIMYVGLLFILFPFEVLSQPLGLLLGGTIKFTNTVLHKIEHLPNTVIKGIWIETWEYLSIYVLMFLILFYLLYKRKVFLWVALLIVFLLVLNSSIEKANLQEDNKVIFYSLRKKSAITFVEGRKMTLLSDLLQDDKNFSFSVQPSIEAGAGYINIWLLPGKKVVRNNIYYDGNFVQFRNWRLLIWNKAFDRKDVNHTISVDALLLSDNPKVTIANLFQYVKFNLLLIDSTNKDYQINKWLREAEKLQVTYYVLKNNPAYIVEL